jgi:pyruvate,water dikinase
MVEVDEHLSTGLAGLDRVLRGLIPGDNLVWQVSSIEDYAPFVRPYCRSARRLGQKLIYFRFAEHDPLVSADDGAEVHELHPEDGFESFLGEIHRTIEETGRGGFYVFDCLTDLAADWYSDQMLGNFFMLTCPYLYDVEAIAYFALLRNYHSVHATSAISETAQVLIDVYRHKRDLYIHPLKVQRRYSPTMYMLHIWQDDFRPVTQSAVNAEILTSAPWRRLASSGHGLGVWHRTFLRAEEILGAVEKGDFPPQLAEDYFRHLVRMAVSRDERVMRLVEKYMDLSGVVDIGSRMIGTGLIGGKSVGMLLARAILRRADERWSELLERHDSFYIGSDVFYTFLVRNGIWWVRQQQKDPSSFLRGAERARQRMLVGEFPEHIVKQFQDMLDYFGQSPIIVRSSSLLEDNFGNAFAGKYESVFCASQGSRDKRLEDFLSAVRTIYASTMSDKALVYRAQRGLLGRDEQMALLVQRVSGSLHEDLFYPHVAGVGFSVNPYVWSEEIDPSAGMLRLVFGLGTRAVDRTDDDYTRMVALNAPDKRPEAGSDAVRQYAQRKVDVLDLGANHLVSDRFSRIAAQSPDLPIDVFASRDERMAPRAEQAGVKDVFPWVLTFDRLLLETPFAKDMREMLRTLHKAYDYAVDVEFTANFFSGDDYRIDLVQCRPLQVKGGGAIVDPPESIPPEDMIFDARGAVIGQARILNVDRIVYVVPAVYGNLPIAQRHAVARLIGQIAHLAEPAPPESILLLGPGRWGTTTPSLGVPASFSEVSTVSALCEIVAMRDDLVPDVSLGTHYFSDLVEMDILYLALFPAREDNFLNHAFLEQSPNKLAELIPEAEEWSKAVRVIDAADLADGSVLRLHANSLGQRAVCYRDRGAGRPAPA